MTEWYEIKNMADDIDDVIGLAKYEVATLNKGLMPATDDIPVHRRIVEAVALMESASVALREAEKLSPWYPYP